jgi:hypothetical protein
MNPTLPLYPWIASRRLPSLGALGGVAITLAYASQASAAITYVDAEHGATGNTFKTGSTQSDTSWMIVSNASTANSTQWLQRTPWGNNGIYQSIPVNASGLSTFPEITTQITGLTNGTTYDVWVFFWDNVTGTNEKWTISAGLTTGALSTYSNDAVTGSTTTGVVNTNTLTFSNSPTITQTAGAPANTYNMFGVKLGQVSVTGGGVNVYVDRNIFVSGSFNRVWYDGVGFEAVPEPSAALLGGLGMILLMRRRSN